MTSLHHDARPPAKPMRAVAWERSVLVQSLREIPRRKLIKGALLSLLGIVVVVPMLSFVCWGIFQLGF